MKKLVLILLAVSAFVACSKDDKNKNNNNSAPDVCTSTESTQSRCSGEVWQTCNGSAWITTKDCAADNKKCVPVAGLANSVKCETPTVPGNEFEDCTGTGQGTCAANLTCGGIDLLSKSNMCFTDCKNNASVCDAGEYCEPGVAGTTHWADSAFCYPKSDRDGMCLYNDDGCNDATATCTSVVGQYNPECKILCDGGTVGTQGTCTSPETCLAGPYVETEDVAGVPKTCTIGQPDTCTAAQKYVCSKVSYSATDIREECARKIGICGTPSDLAPDFANSAAVGTFLNGSDNSVCEWLNADTYCPVLTNGTASMECTGTMYSGGYDPVIPCTGYTDYVSCFGYGECETMDGTTYECRVPANVCTIFCTAADGSGPDLTCPTTKPTCAAPTFVAGLGGYAWQPATSGNFVTCGVGGGSPSDCTAPFTCHNTANSNMIFSDADVCALDRKICK